MRPRADRRRRLRALGVRAGALVLRASGRLVRLRTVGDPLPPGPVIYAFWHGRMWLAASRFGRLRAAVLVSLSEDGEVIAQVARRLGYHPIRGSSSRGGREALDALAGELAGGRSVAITPDGPRGPLRTAQIGTVVLAARSGRPIIPAGFAARPARSLGSWDRFQIPLPGARGAAVFLPPLQVPEEADLEPWRLRLEAALNRAQAEADREVGA